MVGFLDMILGPNARRNLLSPVANDPQNMLTGAVPPLETPRPEIQGYPVASPAMTAATLGPAPQPVQGTQVAGGGGRPSDFSFFTPDRKQFLQDVFLGWAAGKDPSQSLALGAAQAAKGTGDRRNQNKTVDWLKGRGLNEGDAHILAGNPTALGDYIKQSYKQPEAKKPIEVNGQLVNPDTYEVVGDFRTKSDDGSGKPTELQRDLAAAGLKPGTPEWNEAILSKLRPKGMVVESDGQGGFKLVQGADVSGGANLNVEQGKNTGFLLRAQDANKSIGSLEGEGTSIWNNTAGKLPVVGNYALGADAQKYDQAKRDFVNAVLRQESGAVISDQEFANAEKQYFPQPGDSPEVIKQKAGNRQNVIEGFQIRSGPGAAAAAEKSGAPKVGLVQDGYRFKGGDPADQRNWERAK